MNPCRGRCYRKGPSRARSALFLARGPLSPILTGMESFGRKLSEAMRHHGLRLEDVAKATGLGTEDVQALLDDDFGALPGDDVVRRGLQSFAWLVEVDPDQVLEDFRQERQRSAAARPPAPVPAPPVPLKPSKQTKQTKIPARRPAGIVVPTLVIVGVAGAAFLFWP